MPVDDRVSVAIAAYDPLRDVILRKRRAEALPRSSLVKLEKERRRIGDDICRCSEGGRELLVADGRQVGGAQAQATTRSLLRRRARLRRRSADLERLPGRRAPARCARRSLESCCPASRASSILEIAKHDGRPDGRRRRRGRRAARRARGVPHRHERRRLAGRVDRRAAAPAPVPGPVSRAPEDALRRDHRRARSRLRALAHARGRAPRACASSPASSPRASSTSATTSARCASTWRSRRRARRSTSSPTTTR